MSVEKLQEQLAAIKTSEDMFSGELVKASKEMNRIICEVLAKARDEGNTNQYQFASLLVKYQEIWRNKPGLNVSKADLSKADLRKANLFGANLSLADLRKANLFGANLSLADLRLADLRLADLREADLRGADLIEADLRGANLYEANLFGASLREADLIEADLIEANLRLADLRKANLFWANLRKANLFGANLREADLRGADLIEADLLRANLCKADLRKANLFGADLSLADLSLANLIGAIIIGADFTEVKNDTEPMTKDELQAKLADAIKTPDELLKAIQRFLDDSNKNSITKEDLDTLPSLYKAALDIGNNGAKNRKDEFVICQPGDAICQELLSSAHSLNEKFPVLTATPFSGLHDKMKNALAGRGGEVSNFMAAVTFLRGIYANQKDSSLSVLTPDMGVKIVSALLSNGKEADDYLATQIAYQLHGQASTKKFSAKEAIKLKHVLSPDEKALPPVNAILKLEERIIEAVSTARDGEVVIISTRVDGKIYSDDTVKDALKEASGKQILSDAVELNHIQTTDNYIQITMPKDMLDAIRPPKKKEEKTTASSSALLPPSESNIQMTIGGAPVPGVVVGQTRG